MPVDDGLKFDTAQIEGTEIRKSTGYGGIRITLIATLDRARLPLQVDVGFGDVVTPAPATVDYPVLLVDLPVPRLLAYPKHTVVAEKLHAICLLGLSNTRMKDYFDLEVLLREPLASSDLRLAVEATFRRRALPLPATCPAGLSEAFSRDAG